MATGLKPREDIEFSKNDVEMLGDALKDKNFRKLLSEYCEEMQDPAKQALYQKEMTQLEKERGVDITFINPTPGYVIKTSVAGEKKAFINICSNEKVGKPSYSVKVIEGRQGLDWKLPYSLIPPREDLDKKRVRCVVYDVVFHPNTLELANKYKRFREMVNTTACDALKEAYTIILDQKNFRFPKIGYKGMKSSAVIRKPDPDFKPEECDSENLDPDILNKLYPQKSYPSSESNIEGNRGQTNRKLLQTDVYEVVNKREDPKSLYTTPKYTIKQQRDVDFEEFTFDRNAKQYTAMPNNLIVHINLPLISSTADCTLDVKGKSLKLVCEKPARYKLNVTLPYVVDDELGNAKFDKSKHLLIVTLPVVKRSSMIDTSDHNKTDSGVESESNSPCSSDDDTPKRDLVTVLTSSDNPLSPSDKSASSTENGIANDDVKRNSFLDPKLSYILPAYTHNIMDNVIAFTLHVKNTDQSSLVIARVNCHSVQMKFTSVGSGFVPLHYSVFIKCADDIIFGSVTGEAWDNNVILQLETEGQMPEFFSIGASDNDLKTEMLDSSLSPPTESVFKGDSKKDMSAIPPVVEVCNVGFAETNITVTSNNSASDSSNESKPSKNQNIVRKKEIVWADTGSSAGSTKGILRNSWRMTRSLSESSLDGRDIASSMDYMSSESIADSSRLKKTVRFNDVIAKKVFRLNSSILGQKKKNQRKKDKKKNQERRKSESEADDDQEPKMTSKPNKKSDRNKKNGANEKFRRDSGVADVSDTDGDNNKSRSRTEPCDTPHPNPHSPKHKTGLYDPQKLNQGQYLEVSFKNDLIFDLDL